PLPHDQPLLSEHLSLLCLLSLKRRRCSARTDSESSSYDETADSTSEPFNTRPPSPTYVCLTAELAKGPERRPDLLREQLGFFPGGEVAALVGLVEVDQVGVRLLDPAARGREDLAREGGEADRDRDLRGSLASGAGGGLSALPVRPGRRRPGAGQPVQADVVEDVVAGEVARGLAVEEG